MIPRQRGMPTAPSVHTGALLAMEVPPAPPDVVPLPPSPHPVPPPPPTPPEIVEPPMPGHEPVRDPIVVPGEGLRGGPQAWHPLN